MPYKIVKVKGARRPFKIKNRNTGETVGSSVSLEMAKKTIRARLMGEHKKI